MRRTIRRGRHRKQQVTRVPLLAFANGLMETIRSWSRHCFIAALDSNQQRKTNPVDMLFERLTKRIKSEPENWSLDYVEHHLMMEKV